MEPSAFNHVGKKTVETNAKPSLDKSPIGIRGLDKLTFGSFPTGRATLICGGPGCGKTLRKVIGDLSDTEKALVGLQLKPRSPQ